MKFYYEVNEGKYITWDQYFSDVVSKIKNGSKRKYDVLILENKSIPERVCENKQLSMFD